MGCINSKLFRTTSSEELVSNERKYQYANSSFEKMETSQIVYPKSVDISKPAKPVLEISPLLFSEDVEIREIKTITPKGTIHPSFVVVPKSFGEGTLVVRNSPKSADIFGSTFGGEVIERGNHENYQLHRYQYASTSFANTGTMQPAYIVYPKSVEDIKLIVDYARDHRIGIAIRTGGHQYCGASSTYGRNIQIDMTQIENKVVNFRDIYNAQKNTLRIPINFSLDEFNKMIVENRMFVPHGQCSHVHIGGHAHTGGYGQLGRSYGLFGDYISEIEVVTADGQERKASRDENSDLFYAVLGGSPGNYAILTHITINPIHDIHHQHSRGLLLFGAYVKKDLHKLLRIMQRLERSGDLVQDVDFCITVFTHGVHTEPFFKKTLDQQMKAKNADYFGKSSDGMDICFEEAPSVIIVYLQWGDVNNSPTEYFTSKYGKPLFDEIESCFSLPINSTFDMPIQQYVSPSVITPMSELSRKWIFTQVREFDLPYEKRLYITNQSGDGWVEWCTDRIDKIMKTKGCYLSAQIQYMGGENGQFRKKANEGKSYSWRDDLTMTLTLDCFYDPTKENAHDNAIAWQNENDTCAGPNGIFCKEDRKLFWGSRGDINLIGNREVQLSYHETNEKIDYLVEVKRKYDPHYVFTANTFSMPGSKKLPKHIEKWNDEVLPFDGDDKKHVLKVLEKTPLVGNAINHRNL